VNKADGDAAPRARAAAAELRAALHILGGERNTPVLTISGLTGEGLVALWSDIETRWQAEQRSGALAGKRARQNLRWMWTLVEERLRARLRDDPDVARHCAGLEREVLSGHLDAAAAAQSIAG